MTHCNLRCLLSFSNRIFIVSLFVLLYPVVWDALSVLGRTQWPRQGDARAEIVVQKARSNYGYSLRHWRWRRIAINLMWDVQGGGGRCHHFIGHQILRDDKGMTKFPDEGGCGNISFHRRVAEIYDRFTRNELGMGYQCLVLTPGPLV